MIEIEKRVEFNPNEALLLKIASKYTKKDIELIITDNDDIQKLNAKHRGIDKATDVLSFPYEKMKNAPLGTIVISVDKVNELSKELGHSADEEFTLLFIHGLLHFWGMIMRLTAVKCDAKRRSSSVSLVCQIV